MHTSPEVTTSINPHDGQILHTYPFQDATELEHTLARSEHAFRDWRQQAPAQRCAAMIKLAAMLRQQATELAEMITLEMGKPITQARAEIDKCALACDWYAEHGERILAPEPTLVEDNKAWIAYRPLGPVLAVMPWNFPIWQVIRGAVPALIAGNTYVLKHAPNVMGSAYLLRDMFMRAGFPDGVFEVAHLSNQQVSEAIADSRIAAITVTGSVRAGSAIAAQAGAALKKCVLELGGSDAFIVMADADLDLAVDAAVRGRFQNTGQVCAAAKRFIIERPVLQEFTQRFASAVQALQIGDPRKEENTIGPMARFDLRDELDAQVQRTLQEGAVLLAGGYKLEGPGNYYAPTILTNVTPDMTAFKEELFGPVAAITCADDEKQAIDLANNSEFGLMASVFTNDRNVADRITAELEVGGVFINGYSASDVRVGFGGVKKSGYGRELSHFGVREFCNAQTVWTDRR